MLEEQEVDVKTHKFSNLKTDLKECTTCKEEEVVVVVVVVFGVNINMRRMIGTN
jgi:hypothetical protein